MELKEAVLTRRSIRQYTGEPVSAEDIQAIISLARYAPSWKNTQTPRYTLVTDRALLDRIATEGMEGFTPNTETLKGAPALVIQSMRTGISGYERDGSPTTGLGTHWQSFDAGIAAQTFCLIAREMGLGTLIMGIFDGAKIAALINLPEEETVSALLVVGHPASEPPVPKRKDVETLLRIRA